MNIDVLKKIVPDAVSLQAGDGLVWALPGLQGRIVCSLDGEVLHQFDQACAENARPGTFNNVGGNSLWPAPEGGPAAFNYYQADPSIWGVQEAVNSQCPECTEVTSSRIVMAKTMRLANRARAELSVQWQRAVTAADLSAVSQKYGLQAMGYETDESLMLETPEKPEKALVAAWSLEQLPLSEGAWGFMIFGNAAPGMINTGYYGDPEPYLEYDGGKVIFRFTSPAKLQIGADAKSDPRLIGAYLPAKDLLILRETAVIPGGTYIDIADNDQPDGPFAAGDAYSIFYGADLNFFELETIAPMMMENGLVKGSRLRSRSMFFRGDRADLDRMMMDQYGFTLQ